MTKRTLCKSSIVVACFLILMCTINILLVNIHNDNVIKAQTENAGMGTNVPDSTLAADGSDVPDWWVIILILLVVSIIGDIVTIMMIFMKKKEESKSEAKSSSIAQTQSQTEPEKGETDLVGADSNKMSVIENTTLCPKCGNRLKTEYSTCPFCRRELKK